MKRFFALLLAVTLVFALTGCGARKAKKDVFNLVTNNYDAILKACEEKDEEALLSIKGVTRVNMVEGYVIVFCIGRGLSVSSQDYGFYYSANNCPVAIDCNQYIVPSSLTPKGNGLQCVVDGNTFYTEHIKGNIYFYSNAF